MKGHMRGWLTHLTPQHKWWPVGTPSLRCLRRTNPCTNEHHSSASNATHMHLFSTLEPEHAIKDAAAFLPATAVRGALHPSRPLRIPMRTQGMQVTENTLGKSNTISASPEISLQSSGTGNTGGEVDVDEAVPAALARELSLLALEDLAQRIHRFSRQKFAPDQRPLLFAHLRELMTPARLGHVSLKTIQDYLQLANAAGMHRAALNLYHAAREHMPATTLQLRQPGFPAVGGGSGGFVTNSTWSDGPGCLAGCNANLFIDAAVLVSSFLVDSAYAIQSSAELTRLASFCVSQLLAPLGAGGKELSTVEYEKDVVAAAAALPQLAIRTPRETATEVSLLRCLWRTLCLAEYYRRAESTAAQAVQGSKEQAMADASAILKACRRIASVRRAAAQGSAPSPPSPASQPTVDRLLLRMLHLVRYAPAGDEGEFALFQFCKEEHILWTPQPYRLLADREACRSSLIAPSSPVVASSSSASSSSYSARADGYNEGEVEVFYGALIDTCAAGQLAAEALTYFTEARCLLGCPLLGEFGDLSDGLDSFQPQGRERLRAVGEGADVGSAGGTENLLESVPPAPLAPPMPRTSASSSILPFSEASVRDAAPAPALTSASKLADNGEMGGGTLNLSYSAAPPSPARKVFVFTELLIHRLLLVLQAAKSNRQVTRLARVLITGGAAPHLKGGTWTLLLIAAGSMRAADVALAAYGSALERMSSRQNIGSGGEGGSSTSEQHSLEYLLQTSLHALSKCQLPRFEDDYLRPARESQLLRCTDEFYFGCLLQDAHNSMNPAQRAAEVLGRMEEAGVPLTVPLVSRLLKLYLRAEAPEFLSTYRYAVDELRLPLRILWADQLLLWADRRRYFLSLGDREYVVEQMMRSRRVTGVGDLLPLLGGLRTQFSLLHYDLIHAARERFLKDGTVIAEQPTVLDSRAHFLMSRPQSVQRGVMAGAGAWWVCSEDDRVEERDDRGTGQLGISPRVMGDAQRRALRASIAALSGVPLLFPVAEGATSAGDSERLHDEALRVYLADVLYALQRSSNCVTS